MIWGHNILLIFFFVSFHPSGHTCHCIFSPTQCLACQLLSHAYFFRLLREESNFLCKDLRAKRHPLSLHMQCFFLPQNETKQNKNKVWDYIIHLGNEICRRVQFEANEPKGQEMAQLYARHSNTIQNGHVAFCCLQGNYHWGRTVHRTCHSNVYLLYWMTLKIFTPNQLCSQKWCNTSRLMKSRLAIVY